MMAAITAASCGAEVTIYEKRDRIGKKILVTGNGKCNLSNMDMELANYNSRNKEMLDTYFRQFSVFDTIAFFESAGMLVKEKNQGLYPVSEQASTVLDILRMEISKANIVVICNCEVSDINKNKGGFTVMADRTGKAYDKIILACGSKAYYGQKDGDIGYRLAGKMGHSMVPVVPALVQLHCREEYKKALAGVRSQAQICLMVNGRPVQQEAGEVQFVPYGISGIPVFQLSRTAAYALAQKKDVWVKMNLLPQYDEEVFAYYVRNRYETQLHKNLEEFLIGVQNKKINQVMISRSGYRADCRVADIGIKKITEIMREYRKLSFHITQANAFEQAQICAGGVPLHEMTEYLESKKMPGVYIAGELLDVDGRCGGYNLQWAWTSGYIAGIHAAGNAQH